MSEEGKMGEHLPGNRPRFGLALSGGGARGLAHIGVLKELERAKIRVDFMAGTSMGGLIGAAYASGMSPAEIEAVALQFTSTLKLMRLVDPRIPRHGLFQGEQLLAFIRQVLKNRSFSDLRIPLTLVCVDLNTGKEVHLREGNVADAVRATVSLPGIFAPVENNGLKLVDGGVLNNLPVDVVRKMGADIVLGVDVTTETNTIFWESLGKKRFIMGTLGGLIAVLGESMDIIMRQQRDFMLLQSPPDFLLSLPVPPEVTAMTGFNRTAELIALGESTARPMMENLRQTLLQNAG